MQLRGLHDCQVHQHNNPNSKVDDGTSEVGEASFGAGRSMTPADGAQGAQLGSALPAGGPHLHLQTPLHHPPRVLLSLKFKLGKLLALLN